MSPILFEKALLIEDDSSHQFLIKRGVASFIGELEVVATVADALSKDLHKYSLIITDLALPDSQDIQHVAQFIKRGEGVPVLVLTSSNSIRYAVEAMKMGAADFLVKNFGDDFNSVVALSLKRISLLEESRKEQARLERESRALRHAVEHSSDGFAVLSPSGDVLYANGALIHLCGVSTTNYRSMIPMSAERRDEVINKIASILEALAKGETGGAFTQEFKAGESFFTITVSAIGVLCVVRIEDSTERRRREKLQRDLISTTSHDLKGPLSTVLLSSQMLLEDNGLDNPELVRRIARQMGASAQGAIHTIEEFLSAKSIKEGVLVLHPKRLVVQDRLREIVEEFQVTARARSIALSVRSERDGIEATVDTLALGRMVGNLIGNALKFTPKGGAVSVALTDDEASITISVQDTGNGISPEDLPKLFERFSRVEKDSDIAGTGLGLFVVKSLASAHGGSVEVASVLKQGTTFSIRIPKNPITNQEGKIHCLSL